MKNESISINILVHYTHYSLDATDSRKEDLSMAKGSVEKRVKSGIIAFMLKMKAADRYKKSLLVLKAKTKQKLCFVKQWKNMKQQSLLQSQKT